MMKTLILTLMTLLWSDQTLAAKVYVDNGSLFIDGSIEMGDFEKVNDLYWNTHVDEVVIVSGGGVVHEAFLISNLIIDAKLKVSAFYECKSACTFILMSSPDPVIVHYPEKGVITEVGVHRPYHSLTKVQDQVESPIWWRLKGFTQASGKTNKQVDKFLELTYNTDSREMHNLTITELAEVGIRTRFITD